MITEHMIEALEAVQGQKPTAPNVARASDRWGEGTARWAFQQWELRHRARTRFARADSMIFVREALEQATHEAVAAYHASLFPPGALIKDFTVGIGADTIALAARGAVVGFELDAERLAAAQHNLAVHQLTADLRLGDSLLEATMARFGFADPARRIEGRRTLNMSDFTPDIPSLVEHMQGMDLGMIKLTAMLSDDELQATGNQVQFVSYGRECREALVLLGTSAPTGVVAVHVETRSQLPQSRIHEVVSDPLGFLYEADPAAIRAHALGSFGMPGLGDSNGYLTHSQPVESPWLRRYRVLASMPADIKRTRAELKRLSANPILKQRAGIDLPLLARQLGRHGDRPIFVAVWRRGRSLQHTILEPESE